MPKLGVNIDHIATLRQARGGTTPDPLEAARVCERAGADSIVCHLREDRRHIQDADVRALRRGGTTRLNLEMSINTEILRIAARIRPDEATLVPERRQELTTEGGLDVIKHERRVGRAVELLQANGVTVSLFIDPVRRQIARAKQVGAGVIELHTGRYADAKTPRRRAAELKKIREMTGYALSLGLVVNAGHGLDYTNTARVAAIAGMAELNIGYSIICRAVFAGLEKAVRDMARLVRKT